MTWILHHQALVAIIGTWLFNNVITVLVSSLPAPTKDSSQRYIYWFKVTNTIIGNVRRAANTAIEQSPNWQSAVNAHIENLANGANSTKEAKQ